MSVSPIPCEEVTVTVKLLLLGESSVGKTSLVNRYTSHLFDSANTLLTIGIEVRKIIKHLMGRKIRLERKPACIQFGTLLARSVFGLFRLTIFAVFRASC
jgi:GTPase SAR1 family protein